MTLPERPGPWLDAAGLDEDRDRAWVVVREVLNAQGALADAERAGRPPGTEEQGVVTRAVPIVKAAGDRVRPPCPPYGI